MDYLTHIAAFVAGMFVLRLWDFIKDYLDDSDAKDWKDRL